MLRLAVQGLIAPIAIISLIVLIIVTVIGEMDKMKGDDAMGKINFWRNITLKIILTMSGNLAGGALLA